MMAFGLTVTRGSRHGISPGTRSSTSGWRTAAVAFLVLATLSGCRAQAQRATAPETITYSTDRVRFAPTAVPAVMALSGSRQRLSSLLNLPRSLSYGDFVWNDREVPPGRVWVLVDLKAQTMSVFRGGNEIGRTVILYGVDDTPTPIGRFTVQERRVDHVSSVYNAPMPYTLRLTNDGVSIHGSDVRSGLGTHGCLGVPTDFAAKLFDVMQVGDEVLILADARLRAKMGAV